MAFQIYVFSNQICPQFSSNLPKVHYALNDRLNVISRMFFLFRNDERYFIGRWSIVGHGQTVLNFSLCFYPSREKDKSILNIHLFWSIAKNTQQQVVTHRSNSCSSCFCSQIIISPAQWSTKDLQLVKRNDYFSIASSPRICCSTHLEFHNKCH